MREKNEDETRDMAAGHLREGIFLKTFLAMKSGIVEHKNSGDGLKQCPRMKEEGM